MIKLYRVVKEIPIYEKTIPNFDKEQFLIKLKMIENEINTIKVYVGKRQKKNLINLGFRLVRCYHHNDFLRETYKIKSKEIVFEKFDNLVMKIGLAERKYDYNWLEIDFYEIAKGCIINE